MIGDEENQLGACTSAAAQPRKED